MLKWLKSLYLEIFNCFDENEINFKKSKYAADILVTIFSWYKLLNETYNHSKLIKNSWVIYRSKTIKILEKIIIDEYEINDEKNVYLLNIRYKLVYIRKLLDENVEINEILDELRLAAKELSNENKDENYLNKLLEILHKEMLEQLIENDEIFRKKIKS